MQHNKTMGIVHRCRWLIFSFCRPNATLCHLKLYVGGQLFIYSCRGFVDELQAEFEGYFFILDISYIFHLNICLLLQHCNFPFCGTNKGFLILILYNDLCACLSLIWVIMQRSWLNTALKYRGIQYRVSLLLAALKLITPHTEKIWTETRNPRTLSRDYWTCCGCLRVKGLPASMATTVVTTLQLLGQQWPGRMRICTKT